MTPMLLTKLLRDLRTTWGRLLLMEVAVSISLTVFSAALYARVIMGRETSRNYLSTNPASATLELADGIRPDEAAALLAAVRARPWIIDATIRTQFTAQILSADGSVAANPIQLYMAAADDPLRMARFEVKQGSWPPPPDGVLMEQSALSFMQLKVGDTLRVKTPNGAAAADLGRWLEQSRGVKVAEIQVPTPYAHPHQPQMNGIMIAVLVFGAMAMLLSSILVATMLNGLLTRQIPQIGILKAIGARSGRILQLYLLMILAVVLVATLLSILPGILMARAFVTMILTMMLNMEVGSYAVAWWAYAAVGGVGIGLPLLMALVPLIEASRRTVRQAIDYRGVDSQGVTATRFDGWLGRLRGFDRRLLIAFRNIFRRRARHLLSVGLLAAAGTMFMGGVGTMAGLQAVTGRVQAQHAWDVEVALTRPASAAAAADVVAHIPNVTRVESWSRTAGPALANSQPRWSP